MKSWTIIICFAFFLLQVTSVIADLQNSRVRTRRPQRTGTTPSKPNPTPTPGVGNDDLQKMLELVNQQRQQNGQNPLQLDSRLVQAAQKHTDYQASIGQITHDEPGRPLSTRVSETGFKWTALGENVAMGYTSVEAVMNGWMNSPGHRQNILNPQFTHFGSGYVANGNYWTQDFARQA
ncbi:hypothetical protein K7432_003108 [Basidiobolus ranarum]|uniref:SCP domain-containing protein n=1 Tax=Basidiobolus ranarum TaxID=34480 RepID=A0ABR2X0G8_9FUNG